MFPAILFVSVTNRFKIINFGEKIQILQFLLNYLVFEVLVDRVFGTQVFDARASQDFEILAAEILEVVGGILDSVDSGTCHNFESQMTRPIFTKR